MENTTHVRRSVIHHTESTNSSRSVIQSSDCKKLRRTTSLLPEFQTKTEQKKHSSAPSMVISLTLTDDNQDHPEDTTFTEPQSAPPFIMESVFVWPSQNIPPQGAEFYEWSNGATGNLHLSSLHQDCEYGNTSADGKGRNGRSPTTNSKKLHPRNSIDGSKTKEVYTNSKWPRKPPHHLPPLDPSVFEKKKKKRPKAVSSHKRKTKCRLNQPKVMDSGTEICQKKREQDVKQATKAEDQDQCVKEIYYPEKLPSEKSHPKKNTSLAKLACAPVDGSQCQMLNHSVNRGNDNLCFQETLEKAPSNDSGQFKARAPRLSRSIASDPSLEKATPSLKEHNSLAANSTGFPTQKTRAPKHSIASPSSVETVDQAESSNRFSNRPRTLVRVPRGRTYECDRDANDRYRRGEKPIYLPPISTNSQQANGFAKEESHAVEAFPRRSSQPDQSSMNCRAYWRVRRVGVCKDAEDTTMKNNRTHARVLMKKFGQLNVTE